MANGFPIKFIIRQIHTFFTKETEPNPTHFGPEKKKNYLFLTFFDESSTKLNRQIIRIIILTKLYHVLLLK